MMVFNNCKIESYFSKKKKGDWIDLKVLNTLSKLEKEVYTMLC